MQISNIYQHIYNCEVPAIRFLEIKKTLTVHIIRNNPHFYSRRSEKNVKSISSFIPSDTCVSAYVGTV